MKPYPVEMSGFPLVIPVAAELFEVFLTMIDILGVCRFDICELSSRTLTVQWYIIRAFDLFFHSSFLINVIIIRETDRK